MLSGVVEGDQMAGLPRVLKSYEYGLWQTTKSRWDDRVIRMPIWSLCFCYLRL